MATVPYTVSIPVYANGSSAPGSFIVAWGPLANGDDGQPFVAPNRADKSVQILGTFGVGGNVRVEGTNKQAYTPNGVSTGLVVSDYATLTDPQANALDLTTAKIEQVLENPAAIRPRVTAGDGTTAITVYMVVSSAQLTF